MSLTIYLFIYFFSPQFDFLFFWYTIFFFYVKFEFIQKQVLRARISQIQLGASVIQLVYLVYRIFYS